VKTAESDGYNAVQLGFEEIKEKRTTKAVVGHCKKANTSPKRFIREVRDADMDVQVGDLVKVDIFEAGETVDVIGTSKGKGYQGTIVRNNAHMGPRSHGSMHHRHIGSLATNGITSRQGRIMKGTVMAGQEGGYRTTNQNLTVIKVDVESVTDTEWVVADFGSAADLRVADKVMAIGNPGGYELNSSVTIGYVSALNRAITNADTGYTMEFIQTDAAINPGNSGGALVNGYGEVIGINSAKISATGFEGLGFAIPSDIAQPIIDDLITYGYVKDRAMLGISGQYLDALTGRFYGLPQGEYVAALNTEYAAASGLREGDVITAIDSTPLASEGLIRSLINHKKPGETVTLTVYRPATRETVEISLTLSEYSGG
jgi:50S ribosomal protein uL3